MAVKVPVKDIKGKEVAEIDLSDAVFDVPMNQGVVWQALVRQRANARQGTSSTKTRGEVAGSTRKPWRQKHTGRARVGSRKSPLWRHGGIIFGPSPRDFSQAMPRKMRRLAIRCLLTSKRTDGSLAILNDLPFPEGKTKEVSEMLSALNIEGTVLLVMMKPSPEVIRSARNLHHVKTIPAALLNAGDLLKYEHLIMTVDAVRRAEEIWSTTSIYRKRGPVPTEAAPAPAPEAIEPVDEAHEEAPKPKRRAKAKAEDVVAEVPAPSKAEAPEEPAPQPEASAGEDKPAPKRRKTTATGKPRTRSARKKTDS